MNNGEGGRMKKKDRGREREARARVTSLRRRKARKIVRDASVTRAGCVSDDVGFAAARAICEPRGRIASSGESLLAFRSRIFLRYNVASV